MHVACQARALISIALSSARNITKANATSNLQCQPKHVSCKCTGPKGEQYSGDVEMTTDIRVGDRVRLLGLPDWLTRL